MKRKIEEDLPPFVARVWGDGVVEIVPSPAVLRGLRREGWFGISSDEALDLARRLTKAACVAEGQMPKRRGSK